jgi:PIN domain nuclease of toxin-antitoxin system
MARVVLDASALLAFMNAEPGGDVVAEVVTDAIISSVNLSEAIAWLTRKSVPAALVVGMPPIPDLEVVPFDRGLSIEAGLMVRETARAGLSFGDRACLALARRERLPAYTADKAWLGLDINVDVRMIR